MATIAKLDVLLGMKDEFSDKLDAAANKLNAWGENLRSIGTKMTAGVTLPLVGAGIAAITWASDLDQAMGKSEAVFGDQASIIQEWAKGTAKAYGFAQSESIAMASTYGSLFKVMGMTNDVAADYSMELIGLAADMSAFNDVSNERSSQALMAGLTGEYMSLRSMGVFLNEAMVNQEALNIAMADGRDVITDADKVQARYNLILEQTAQQQGQAARESGNFASRMAQVRARVKDVGASIGQRLMPFALRFLDFVERMVGLFDKLSPKMQTAALVIAALAAAMGPVLLIIGMLLPGLAALATVIGLLLSPIGLLVIAIAALIALGIYAWANDLWGVRDAVNGLMDALQVFEPMVGDLVDAFQALREGDYDEVFHELRDAFYSFVDGLQALWPTVRAALAGIGQSILEWAAGVDWGNVLSTAGSLLIQGIKIGAELGWEAIKWYFTDLPLTIIGAIGDAVSTFYTLLNDHGYNLLAGLYNGAVEIWNSTVQPWLSGVPGLITEALGEAWNEKIKPQGTALLTGFLNGVVEYWPTVYTWLSQLGAFALAAIPDISRTIRQKGLDLLAGFYDGILDKWPEVKTWLGLLGTWAFIAIADISRSIRGKGLDLMSGFYDGILDRWPAVKGWLAGLPGYCISAVGNLSLALFSKGWDLISGLASGIRAAASNLVPSAIGYATGLVIEGISNIPGFSPIEHVGQFYGRRLGEGFAEGISSASRMVNSASTGLAGTAIPPLDQSVTGGNGRGGQVINIITLEPGKWQEFLANAQMGGDFARAFAPELAMRSGQP